MRTDAERVDIGANVYWRGTVWEGDRILWLSDEYYNTKVAALKAANQQRRQLPSGRPAAERG